MKKLERTFMLMSRGAATLGVLFLLLVAAMSVADIVVREITGRPIRGAHDLASLLTIIIIASSFPAGLLERRQIKVTVLGSFLPESINRAMEVLGAVLTGAMFLFIAYFVTLHAMRVSDNHQATMVLNMPIGPWWWIASICFWACIPAQLFVIIAEILGQPAAQHQD
ncbi:TRAP-type C4-dicarboxylate transport system permease small subunit [Hoeflea halophila]|uniref:TRAP transporter small permease protein n=1 Tax=Hoeflea halophila TaxID=714899 RepID=A0A286IDN8_9HYPH|nr:TRAP transporter small permease subunit [Hoeflea halophila]SOE18253.1 TRAP-type C4-dicarboxylate transport system permease small subunit [Hoeflea halophila]